MNIRPLSRHAELWRFLSLVAAASPLFFGSAFSQSIPKPSDEAPTAAGETVQLSTFSVNEKRETGYESMQTTSGMRTVQELKNVANSISVVNSQLIQDLGAINIEDMTKWTVTGEGPADPAVPGGVPRLIFRGIQNNYAIRNGWIWYSPIDAYSTERVELLRGPNAFLYGEADLGGAQNQITKRGQFSRDFVNTKLMVGSFDLRRAELDINRRLGNKVALRIAAVKSKNETWWDHGRRDFSGLYSAVTYRPFRDTTITVMGEIANYDEVRSQGLFADAFGLAATSTYNNASGVVYLPANDAVYRLTGRARSTGIGIAVVNPAIVPREYQFNGPNATNRADQKSLSVEIEQHVGKSLHFLLSANYYQTDAETWNASGRAIIRDLNATLPGGAVNPYYNELYTEYQRTHQNGGNVVRDVRLSTVYDLNLSWMRQQIALNIQQHQDNPGQKFPKMAEFVSPTNAAFLGTVNSAMTQAAFTANRTVFGNNKFIRRYYLKDGDGARLTGSISPVAGVSDYFPDIGSGVAGAVGATGAIIDRRFYTPSIGVGAAGTYFNGHLHTLLGFRRDKFRMKTISGVPQQIANTWKVEKIDGGFSEPAYLDYTFDGSNYGAVYRVNDMLAFTVNRAQSFRLSLGDGNDGYRVGTKQGIPYGEGTDIGIRLTFLGGRLEANLTHYNNYQPNSRITPLGTAQQNVKNELAALFPTTFNTNGTDTEQVTTSGMEAEIVANLTSNWRLMINAATNEIVTENRLPLLHGFQDEAKKQNLATPLLDAFLPTMPDGVPTAGYTKTRVNLFTRYDFKQGALKGFYFGGGVSLRDRTFRGNADVNQDGVAEKLWSPRYEVVSLLAGYRTKLFEHRTTFALNVDNLLDTEYYRSAATAAGSWGDPRTFKLTASIEF